MTSDPSSSAKTAPGAEPSPRPQPAAEAIEAIEAALRELGLPYESPQPGAYLVRLEPPCPQTELADWYRAATVVLVPSHSESFGLVALEAQACGTPVVAAAVGGLRTAVWDGYSGVLVNGHDPIGYARVLEGLIDSPGRLAELSRGARAHASAFDWPATADRLIGLYTGATNETAAAVGA